MFKLFIVMLDSFDLGISMHILLQFQQKKKATPTFLELSILKNEFLNVSKYEQDVRLAALT